MFPSLFISTSWAPGRSQLFGHLDQSGLLLTEPRVDLRRPRVLRAPVDVSRLSDNGYMLKARMESRSNTSYWRLIWKGWIGHILPGTLDHESHDLDGHSISPLLSHQPNIYIYISVYQCVSCTSTIKRYKMPNMASVHDARRNVAAGVVKLANSLFRCPKDFASRTRPT